MNRRQRIANMRAIGIDGMRLHGLLRPRSRSIPPIPRAVAQLVPMVLGGAISYSNACGVLEGLCIAALLDPEQVDVTTMLWRAIQDIELTASREVRSSIAPLISARASRAAIEVAAARANHSRLDPETLHFTIADEISAALMRMKELRHG